MQDRFLSAGPLGKLLALVFLTFQKVFLLKGLINEQFEEQPWTDAVG